MKIVAILLYLGLSLIGFHFPLTVCGKTYYVSFRGNDYANGRSPQAPWRSLEKVNQNQHLFLPGDSVLFEAGGAYSGELKLRIKGERSKPIIIGRYGKGSRPEIKGCIPINFAATEKKNYWKSSVNPFIKGLVYGESWSPQAKTPNQGFYKIRAASHHWAILDSSFRDFEKAVGTVLRVRSIDWAWEHTKIIRVNKDTLFFEKRFKYAAPPKWGAYLDDNGAWLDSEGEWHYDSLLKQLHFFSENLELNEQAQAIIQDNGLTLEDAQNIVIEKIIFTHFADYGINLTGYTRNVRIQNCELKYIGRSGIYCAYGEELKITGNRLSHCLGRGVDAAFLTSSVIEYNLIENIGLHPGLGISGVNGMTGVLVEGGHWNVIRNNILNDIGYIGIRPDGSYNLVENNIVTRAMRCLDDGGGIYAYGVIYPAIGSVLRNNYISYSWGNVRGTTKEDNRKLAVGLYLDACTHNFEVYNNVCYKNRRAGFLANYESYGHIVQENWFWDNYPAQVDVRADKDFKNFQFSYNTIWNFSPRQIFWKILNTADTLCSLGKVNNNRYLTPYSYFFAQSFQRCYPCLFDSLYTVEKWIHQLGYDNQSKFWLQQETFYKAEILQPSNEFFLNASKKLLQWEERPKNHNYQIQEPSAASPPYALKLTQKMSFLKPGSAFCSPPFAIKNTTQDFIAEITLQTPQPHNLFWKIIPDSNRSPDYSFFSVKQFAVTPVKNKYATLLEYNFVPDNAYRLCLGAHHKMKIAIDSIVFQPVTYNTEDLTRGYYALLNPSSRPLRYSWDKEKILEDLKNEKRHNAYVILEPWETLILKEPNIHIENFLKKEPTPSAQSYYFCPQSKVLLFTLPEFIEEAYSLAFYSPSGRKIFTRVYSERDSGQGILVDLSIFNTPYCWMLCRNGEHNMRTLVWLQP
jgi:hypothetical protein